MPLYNKKDTYFVLFGIMAFHMLTLGLCLFFTYKFLVVSYDYSGYVLLVFLFSLIVIVDIMLWKSQGYSRFLVRCMFDPNGIHCRILGFRQWQIRWDDICVYGLCGYGIPGCYGIAFFSTDEKELYDRKKCVSISKHRIIFQVTDSHWSRISEYMPVKMKTDLEHSIDKEINCFYRYKKSK